MYNTSGPSMNLTGISTPQMNKGIKIQFKSIGKYEKEMNCSQEENQTMLQVQPTMVNKTMAT
jgi:hypothetical protein